LGIELVDDEPQREVFQEIDLIKKLEEMAIKWTKTCEETIRCLRKFWIQLSKELADKKSAFEIDTRVISFNQHSSIVARQEPRSIQDCW